MKTELPLVKNANLAGKKVLVRVDLDVPSVSNPRVESVERIVAFLMEQKVATITAVGHRGEYAIIGELRIEHPDVEWSDTLRDDPREKANDVEFAKEIAGDCDVYINEAFAVSHRNHASIVSVPKVVKERGGQVFLGLRFGEEVETLEKVLTNPGKKVLVIGGAKAADKAAYAMELASKFDRVLVGGLLPDQISSTNSQIPSNMILGKLTEAGTDINDETIDVFKKEIADAGVIVVAGPMGKFEDAVAEKGTKEIFEAVVNTKAFKVAGGGNTEDAIAKFNLADKLDWISVGGGAMLEFLINGTLVGIEALK